jgi:hypothetical protein
MVTFPNVTEADRAVEMANSNELGPEVMGAALQAAPQAAPAPSSSKTGIVAAAAAGGAAVAVGVAFALYKTVFASGTSSANAYVDMNTALNVQELDAI